MKKIVWQDLECTGRFMKIPDFVHEFYKKRSDNNEAGSISRQLFEDLVNNGGFSGRIEEGGE